ncbi:hypothetical protein R6L23_02470 [Streptomyces sp. SR27]|uniref:RipA family octameric membrane protein n=1 Tax=Streptomyces sp. SR27 TaxID=3076630 RepID=UPI00295C364E|nr:hypothetical protein [Streptomyces sp. SR27]MDV9187091.1 hypothetical protein [Streptomyces sp. SR27]
MPDELEELRSAVWNADWAATPSPLHQQQFHQHLLEQYKIYVEMADRMSARRALTNSFFLAVNLAAIGAVGTAVIRDFTRQSSIIPVIASLILMSQCFAWFHTLRSYRMLNKAKYSVIEILEEKLPARVYSKGEWGAYVRSGKRGRYLRLTTAEQMMPVIFGAGYFSVLLYSLRSG